MDKKVQVSPAVHEASDSTGNLRPLSEIGPTWKRIIILNKPFFAGPPYAPPGLFFLCQSQVLTYLPPENIGMDILVVVISTINDF